MMKQTEPTTTSATSTTSTRSSSISKVTQQLANTSLLEQDHEDTNTTVSNSRSSSSSSIISDNANDNSNQKEETQPATASVVTTSDTLSLEFLERQLECISWYHRLGSPTKDVFGQRIATATGGRLSAADIEALPWKGARMIDVAAVNARVRQAHRRQTTKE